ncbi:MAG: glycerophosphodiester phosphodiesterase [SAR324 cluster bacterium]
MEIFAHRGNSGEAPENTLAAFRQVLDVGADGVEFDVHLSRDGIPVVIHDEVVNRTSDGNGWVRDMTLAELQRLDVGKWFGAEFAGERIPTLEATVGLFRGSALRVNIELKTDRVAYPGLARAVTDMVRRIGMQRQALVSSFNHLTLLEARTMAPELEYAVLSSDQMLEPWQYVRRYGFQAYHPRGVAVDEELVRRCHEAGIKVRPWVVDDLQLGARLAALGVDALITNHPRRFVRADRPA